MPLEAGQVYVYATANDPPVTDELAELRRRFGRWHDPIPGLLDVLEPARLLRHDVSAVRPSLRRFHQGRVVLLGDAAHAMEPNLGQGAGLAMEDAVVLGYALADGASMSWALERYSRARAGRAARLSRQSSLLGRLGQSTSRAVVAARDAGVRWTPERVALRGFDLAAGWQGPL